MKKEIKSCLVAAVMLISGTTVMAQQNSMPQFGVRAAFDMTTSTKMTEMTGFGPGGSIGCAYIAPFGKMAFFQGSLYFLYNTIQYKGVSGNEYQPIKIDGNIDNVGLRLPLDIGLFCVNNDKFRLSVYTGPQFYINFSTKGKYDEDRYGHISHQDVKLTNSGLDVCWGLGIGADFNRRWHVHIEGVYGLTNMCMVELMNDHIRRASISVGIGYNFDARTKHGHRRAKK